MKSELPPERRAPRPPRLAAKGSIVPVRKRFCTCKRRSEQFMAARAPEVIAKILVGLDTHVVFLPVPFDSAVPPLLRVAVHIPAGDGPENFLTGLLAIHDLRSPVIIAVGTAVPIKVREEDQQVGDVPYSEPDEDVADGDRAEELVEEKPQQAAAPIEDPGNISSSSMGAYASS